MGFWLGPRSLKLFFLQFFKLRTGPLSRYVHQIITIKRPCDKVLNFESLTFCQIDPPPPPRPPLLSPFLLLIIIHSDHIRSKFQTLKVNKHLQAYTEILSGNESISGKIKFWGIFWQFLTPRLPKNSQPAMKLCKLLKLKIIHRI